MLEELNKITYENLTIKDLSLLLKILNELKETKEEIEVL